MAETQNQWGAVAKKVYVYIQKWNCGKLVAFVQLQES